MNKIIFNLESNTIKDKIINQPLIMGQSNFYNFEFEFQNNAGDILYNTDWRVSVVFERADSEKTNNLPILLLNNKYKKEVVSWISDVAGELKLSVYLKDTEGNIIQAIPVVMLNVAAGIQPSGDTITNAQYQDIINQLAGVVRTIFIQREETIINYEAENYTDVTYINKINSAELVIPDSVKHGFYHGINFITDGVVDFNIINNSDYPLVIFKYGRLYPNLIFADNNKVNLIIYCDGININLHFVNF